jgi:hypothetical protein
MLQGKIRDGVILLVGLTGGAMSSFGPMAFPGAPHWIWSVLFFVCAAIFLAGLVLLLIDLLPKKDGAPLVPVWATTVFSCVLVAVGA